MKKRAMTKSGTGCPGVSSRRKASSARALVAVAGGALALGACDLSVSNPGPIQDEFLNDPQAAAAVVNGMEFQLSNALGWIAYTGGIIALEIVPSGHNTDAYGVREQARQGRLVPGETESQWENAHEARWLAEDGIRRFREVLGEEFASSELAARALLYAGFSNRLLGENMCQAVYDGGPAEDSDTHFTRAEEQFTEALSIARTLGNETLELAALGGRASVRLGLGDWAEAVADAGAVPTDFVYVTRYNLGAEDQYNRLHEAVANNPHRNFSVYSTFYDDYYETTGDPRTPWTIDPEFPVGTVGNVPFLIQQKYPERTTPMNLTSGREMRLIEAEAMLRNGDVAGAMEIVNGLRAAVGMEPWDVASETEAWVALKRERGIELWLEARRLPDLRRWAASGAPGQVEDMSQRDLCFPIGLSEMETNPNIPMPG